MWGNVIQDIIRNYLMMQMLGGDKNKFTVDTPTPAPHAMEPDMPSKAPSTFQPQPFPGGNDQLAQFLPMIIQMLQRYQG